MKKVSFGIILFLISLNVLGQIKNNHYLKKELLDSHKVQLYNYLSMLDTMQHGVKKASIYNKVSTLYTKANYYLKKSKDDSIEFYAQKAISLTKGIKTNQANLEYITGLSRIGYSLKGRGNYTKALNYFDKILKFTDSVNTPSLYYELRQEATSGLCGIYEEQGNLSLALEIYESLLDYVEKNLIEKTRISSIVYMRLSRLSRKLNKLNKALHYAQKALELAIKNNLPHRIGMVFLEMVSIKMASKNYIEAEQLLTKAFKNLKDTKYVMLLARFYLLKAKLAAVYGNKWQKVKFAEKAFELNKMNQISSDYVITGTFLSQSYEELGQHKKANDLLKKVMEVEGIIKNNEAIYQSAQKEISRKENNIIDSKKQYLVFALLFFFIVLAIVIFAIQNQKNKIKAVGFVNSDNATNTNDLDKISNSKNASLALIENSTTYSFTETKKEIAYTQDTNNKLTVASLSQENKTQKKANLFNQTKIEHTELISILVVTNNNALVFSLKKDLKVLYKVYTVVDNAKAIEILKNTEVDLIISDFTTQKSYYEFKQRLKADSKLIGIPTITLYSPKHNTKEIEEITVGMDDYLIKPFVSKQLLVIIKKLLLYKRNRGTCYKSKNSLKVISKADIEWIQSVKIRFTEELENNQFKVTDLASEMCLSVRQFQRKIKKITGLSPKRLQREIALQEARRLLENNSYGKISAVSNSVGIYNVSRFSEQFEARFGKKTSDYF